MTLPGRGGCGACGCEKLKERVVELTDECAGIHALLDTSEVVRRDMRKERDTARRRAMVEACNTDFWKERAEKAEAEVARLLHAAAVDAIEKDGKALLERDLLRMRAEKAEADVKACQEVYAAARRVVQTWRDRRDLLVPHLERLAKTVGL